MKETFIIISNNKCPCKDAGSIRQHVFAKILSELGYDVFVYSIFIEKSKVFDGISYCSLNCSKSKLSKISNYLWFSKKVLRDLNEKEIIVNNVLFIDLSIISTIYLKIKSTQKCIKLFHDSVEWYSLSQFNYNFLNYSYIKKNILNKFLINKKIKVFSISSYLCNYFYNKGISTIRVPVIMQRSNLFKISRSDENLIKFVYAGVPGKKDKIDLIVKSFISSNNQQGIFLNILGITEKTFSKKYKKVYHEYKSMNNKNICFWGRVEHNKALEVISNSDFAFLFRNGNKRYAKAGFPTKVVESMMNGTPVICNISSDLDLYLVDNYNSIIVKSISIKDIVCRINDLILKTNEEILCIKRNALESANKYFSYESYVSSFKQFINGELNG